MAKAATKKMLDLLPPLDVSDPKAFITAIVAIFAEYPEGVMAAAIDPVRGIPSRTDRPTLKLIKAVCEEIYQPMLEEQRRRDGVDLARLAIGPPRRERTQEEQARVDKLVAETRQQLGIPEGGIGDKFRPRPSDDMRINARELQPRDDGRHGQRVAADLAARAERRQAHAEGEAS